MWHAALYDGACVLTSLAFSAGACVPRGWPWRLIVLSGVVSAVMRTQRCASKLCGIRNVLNPLQVCDYALAIGCLLLALLGACGPLIQQRARLAVMLFAVSHVGVAPQAAEFAHFLGHLVITASVWQVALYEGAARMS